MSYYTVTVRRIEVIGTIWMPAGTCAMVYDLQDYEIECIGELTRDNVRAWLNTHSGDFQIVQDFHADIADFDSPWEHVESEGIFADCM